MPTSSEEAAAAAAAAAAEAAFREFAIEAWTLLAVAILVTVVRTLARVRAVGWAQLRPDDYLVWVGLIFYSAETALAYSVGTAARGLANNSMSDQARANLRTDDPEFQLRVTGSKIQVAGWSTYSVLLWSFKASVLFFYIRLTEGLHRGYKQRINVGFGLLAATWVGVVLTLVLSCRPIHRYWQIHPDPGNACQPAVSSPVIWTFLAMNASTDLYIMSIPIPMLWKAGMKTSRKVVPTVVLGAGLLIIVCAMMRSVLILIDPVNGPQLAGAWGVRESFVATVTTNLPVLFPLVKRLFKPLFSSIQSLGSSRKQGSTRTRPGFQTIGGGGGSGPYDGGGRYHKRGRVPSVDHLPTKNESEERIIGNTMEMQKMRDADKEDGTSRDSVDKPSRGHRAI